MSQSDELQVNVGSACHNGSLRKEPTHLLALKFHLVRQTILGELAEGMAAFIRDLF